MKRSERRDRSCEAYQGMNRGNDKGVDGVGEGNE